MAEVLIAEDERVIRDHYARLLSGEGYGVRTARDGAEALKKFGERRPDLVILDIEMPRMNGFAACREIRARDRALPVLFLTANDTETNEVRGLAIGGDDFVAKTDPESVLLARVRRALDRAAAARDGSAEGNPNTIRLGKTVVDLGRLSVAIDGAPGERLTKTEGDILRTLADRKGDAVSKDDLIAALRGEGFACEDAMLYVHVSNLRRKLGAAGERLVALRRTGYRLVTDS